MFSRLIYLLSFNMSNNLWPSQPRSSVLDILYFVYASYAAVVPEVSTSRRCVHILSRILLPTVRLTQPVISAVRICPFGRMYGMSDILPFLSPADEGHISPVRGLSGLTDCNIIDLPFRSNVAAQPLVPLLCVQVFR
jgi:hypothetical protein